MQQDAWMITTQDILNVFVTQDMFIVSKPGTMYIVYMCFDQLKAR